MKKSIIRSILVLCSALSCSFSFAAEPAVKPPDFSHITAFAAGQDRLGFFDQSSGKIYIYDSNGKTCLFQGQLKELGKPLVSVQRTTPTPTIRSLMDPGARVMINDKGEKTVILSGSPAER